MHHRDYRHKDRERIDKNGHPNIPAKEPTLGRWVTKQRSDKLKSKLSEDRIRLPDELGFIWNPPKGPRQITK